MPRLYQRKIPGITMPTEVFRMAFYFAKSIPRLRKKQKEISFTLENGIYPQMDYKRIIPNNRNINPSIAENYIAELMEIKEKILIAENAIKYIPEEYRKGVLERIEKNKSWPNIACKNTWSAYQQVYIYHIAKLNNFNLGEIYFYDDDFYIEESFL
ncbi:MAG: hypothetical protein ACRCUS_00110 [Anaerovoracaceae bacterium]